MTHAEGVEIGYKWALKNGHCGVAFKELNTATPNGEYPDVIGFASGGFSLLIEVKVSRSDFLADKNKMFRKNPELGMGSRRYYLCPKGLIKVEELPDDWGLIEVENGKARLSHNPYGGNMYMHSVTLPKNIKAEHCLMYSALRRLFIKGYVKHIYDKQYASPDTNSLIKNNEP